MDVFFILTGIFLLVIPKGNIGKIHIKYSRLLGCLALLPTVVNVVVYFIIGLAPNSSISGTIAVFNLCVELIVLGGALFSITKVSPTTEAK
jgi:hypothetical protein